MSDATEYTRENGTVERPYTHATADRTREQGRWCKCARCGLCRICTPWNDYSGTQPGQPLICTSCSGPYMINNDPVNPEYPL